MQNIIFWQFSDSDNNEDATSNSVGHKQHCSCLDLDDNDAEIGACSDEFDAAATVSLSADIEQSFNDDDIDVQSKNDRLMEEANSELFWLLSLKLKRTNECIYLTYLFPRFIYRLKCLPILPSTT